MCSPRSFGRLFAHTFSLQVLGMICQLLFILHMLQLCSILGYATCFYPSPLPLQAWSGAVPEVVRTRRTTYLGRSLELGAYGRAPSHVPTASQLTRMDYVLQTADSCLPWTWQTRPRIVPSLDYRDPASLLWRWRTSKTGRKAMKQNLPVVLDDRARTSRE